MGSNQWPNNRDIARLIDAIIEIQLNKKLASKDEFSISELTDLSKLGHQAEKRKPAPKVAWCTGAATAFLGFDIGIQHIAVHQFLLLRDVPIISIFFSLLYITCVAAVPRLFSVGALLERFKKGE